MYVVTDWAGAVNEIVAVVFVLADTDKLVGVLGTFNVLVETVAAGDVAIALDAVNDIV